MDQTSVTKTNQQEFYRYTYPVLGMPKHELIDISKYPNDVVIVDSAGWYYQQHFPNSNIIKIEHIENCKQYSLDRTKVDKIFNNSVPKLNCVDPVLIFDHAPILKYKNTQELKQFLDDFINIVNPAKVYIRLNPVTSGDDRFQNRITNFISLVPETFIVNSFTFFPTVITIEISRKKVYDIN